MRALVLGLGIGILGRPALAALRRTVKLASFSAPEPLDRH
jgi:hypothetical protein